MLLKLLVQDLPKEILVFETIFKKILFNFNMDKTWIKKIIRLYTGSHFSKNTFFTIICRSETEKKNIFEDLFSSVLSQLKKISPLWRPEISLFRHFQKLKIA